MAPAPDDSFAFEQLRNVLDPESRISRTRANDYLAHLAALAPKAFDEERERLAQRAAKLGRETASAASRHQGCFVRSYTLERECFERVEELQQTTSEVLACSELLNAAVKAIGSNEDHDRVLTKRERLRLVHNQNERITRILELPSMIRTCVANEYFYEAIDLINHANLLKARYPDSAIVQSHLSQVDASVKEMIQALLGLLRKPIKLASALKVVNCLKRIGNYEPSVLRRIFLFSQLQYLKDSLQAISPLLAVDEDSVRYLKRYIEVFRDQSFSMLQMDQSLFPAPDSAEHGSFSSEYHGVRTAIVHAMIDMLMEAVLRYAPNIKDTFTRKSILTQLLYCSGSLARAKSDFSALLSQVFTEQEIAEASRGISGIR